MWKEIARFIDVALGGKHASRRRGTSSEEVKNQANSSKVSLRSSCRPCTVVSVKASALVIVISGYVFELKSQLEECGGHPSHAPLAIQADILVIIVVRNTGHGLVPE